MSNEKNKLPFLARIFIRAFLDNYDYYFLTGDLEEVYFEKRKRKGRLVAWLWLTIQILKSVPPLIIDNIIWSLAMFKNYLKIAYRNIIKNKVYSLINITGLSVGLACCLIIFLFVKYETSFENFHSNADRIYRVNIESKNSDGIVYETCVPFPFADAFRTDFPDLDPVTQIFFSEEIQVESNNELFTQQNALFVDSSFLKIFDYEFVLGNPNTFKKDPQGVVLTQTAASKYFGNESPLGRVLRLENLIDVTVTGVIKDPPLNTHLPVEMLISTESLTDDIVGFRRSSWGTLHSGNIAYILLPEKMTIEQMNELFARFEEKHLEQDRNDRQKYFLQPIKDIHTNSQYGDSFNYVTGREKILVFSIVGILILIIASINFVNLTVAQSMKRSKEVGMRKVIGAHRIQLIRQFFGETFVYTALSFLLSIVIAQFAAPYASKYLGNNSELSIFSSWDIMGYLFAIFVAVNLLTGLYPAMILSGFNPVNAFRNKISVGSRKSFSLRNSLVVFQFIISQVLIVSTIVISTQLDFVRTKDLGFKRTGIITVNLPESDNITKLDALKNRLLQNSDITDVTFCGGAPMSGAIIDTRFTKIPEEGMEPERVFLKPIDEDYLRTYGIKLLAGRNISKYVEGDTLNKYIVNETLIRKIGITDPQEAVGQYIRLSRYRGEIIGVVEDFHSSTLQNEISPVLFTNIFRHLYFEAGVKTTTANFSKVVDFLETNWAEMFPEYNFDYEFFEDYLNKQYQIEENFFEIIKLFAVIAIIIGCLGLFGMISFIAAQRKKEIGVRKAMGANARNIFGELSKEFLRNVLIASILAWPVAYYLMNKWLQDFAYRIPINAWMFIVAGIIALVIAFVTVSFQSVKASLSNPVDSLRYE